jgi:phosphate starvation-inducible PhoH-like protein
MKKIALPQEGLETLYGAHDGNLKHIETLLGVQIRTHGGELIVEGDRAAEQKVERIFEQLGGLIAGGYDLRNGDVRTAAQLVARDEHVDLRPYFLKEGQKQPEGTRRRVNPKSTNQRRYLESIERFDIVFGVGPAGTGKTYLAMAQAVSYLLAKRVSRIILARPAVEAGEKLGFLPGDLQEKVNPYLRPLYDALYDMMDTERATRLVERGTIEVAPIAFMRGRTLNDAFVILDEAQNTTVEQMKMFLTRLGYNSKAVITGDVTQVDLPTGKMSGLNHARSILKNIEGINVSVFTDVDVVRHPLVQEVIRAYERFETAKAETVKDQQAREAQDPIEAEGAEVEEPIAT